MTPTEKDMEEAQKAMAEFIAKERSKRILARGEGK